MELLEHTDALATLDRLLASPGGAIALVAGEAGAGKSTVVGAFAATGRGRVLWGSFSPADPTGARPGARHRPAGGQRSDERLGAAPATEAEGRGAVFDALQAS